MVSFITPNRHGYSVRFSPFDADSLVVASSQNYGLAGAGTLYLLKLFEDGSLHEISQSEWTDGLFDVVWSKQNEGIVATSSGDGSLQIWNVAKQKACAPIVCFREHNSEVYSIDWADSHLLSASWDRTIKLWDATRVDSISTFSDHTDVIFNAMFSNFLPNIFSSVGADGALKIWSSLIPKPLVSVENCHDGEALSCDWSKINQNLVSTGGSDGLIRGWDLRNMSNFVFELYGCEYAVRRIRFSPFAPNVILSAAYDFTTRIWDYQTQVEPLETIMHHSEFVYGIDWNSNRENQIADCGWDSLVRVFAPKCLTDV